MHFKDSCILTRECRGSHLLLQRELRPVMGAGSSLGSMEPRMQVKVAGCVRRLLSERQCACHE